MFIVKEFFDQLKVMVEEYGTGPKFEEMPRRDLVDKGIGGPTAAHIVEEIHCPTNLNYVTFTTGSSAFQNIVGVTHTEIANRITASHTVFNLVNVKKGSKVLFTYPPLVNVFSKQALECYGLKWSFLIRSSRDAFLEALYREEPDVIVGESSFIKTALIDAKRLGILNFLPKNRTFIFAGTPLDLDALPVLEEINGVAHDLYGCQEFGWMILNGMPVREDISLIESHSLDPSYGELVVGGMPMGDSFILSDSGHILNPDGKIITYRRKRTYPEYEVIVKATTLSSKETIDRVARTILRIKSRVVKVDPNVVTSAENTVLEYRFGIGEQPEEPIMLKGPTKTILFDDLVKAQLEYQQMSKTDPTWIKRR